MLANLEHLDFSFEQLDILEGQFFLLHNLDCDLLAGLLVLCSLDETILTLSEGLLQLVEVVQVGVSDSLLNFLHPLVSLHQGVKVVDSSLVGEDQHEWIKSGSVVLEQLLCFTLDKHSCQRLHIFVLLVSLLFVGVKLFA